jgi:hypothetical protein
VSAGAVVAAGLTGAVVAGAGVPQATRKLISRQIVNNLVIAFISFSLLD